MANEQNLIPGGHKLTLEEQSKGGIASGKARRDRRTLRDALDILLTKEFKNKDGKTATGVEVGAIYAINNIAAGER